VWETTWLEPKRRACRQFRTKKLNKDYAMRHSHTSRNYAKAFFAFVTIGLAGGCADSVIAPSQIVGFKAPAGFNRLVGTESFWVGAEGITQRLGLHSIEIPSGAICDPAISTYGPGEWDQPCTPLARPIQITATIMEDDRGFPYIDFQPALRFVPTREVNLYLRSGKGPRPQMLNTVYCNNEGVCVDEAANDATLQTRRIGRSAILVRRIKHFSGYSINIGDECPGTVTEELDGTLMCWEDVGNERRSGYMVASGVTKTKKPAPTVSTGGKKFIE
jgi:hypothetical protein